MRGELVLYCFWADGRALGKRDQKGKLLVPGWKYAI